MKMRELMAMMQKLAPAELCEPWDNSGLLVGHPEGEIHAILLCVDVTPARIRLAKEKNANVLLAHHPLLFGGAKTLREDSYEGALLTALVRENRMLFAAHTNLDRADGGVEDCLAEALGIDVTQKTDYVRMGQIRPQTVGEYLHFVRRTISPQAMFYGDETALVRTAASSCGAGGEFFADCPADVFVTGEMKHHHRMEANGQGMQVIVAGHEETERVVLQNLAQRLRKRMPVPVYVAE